MGDIHTLNIKQRENPFCSLIMRITSITDSKVVRLYQPTALVLGLDKLTVLYIISMFEQYNHIVANKINGAMLDRIYWRDNMPRVCVTAIDPEIDSKIQTLTEEIPCQVIAGNITCRTAMYKNMEACIKQGGISWSFYIEQTLYDTESIPKTVFTEAKKRFNK